MRDISTYLPDQYKTALPVYPRDHDPIREFNTGRVYRENACFGVSRCHVKGHNINMGSYVSYGDPDGLRQGRVKAIYVDMAKSRLCVSIERLLSQQELLRELQATAPDTSPREPNTLYYWQTPLIDEHVPVCQIQKPLSVSVPGLEAAEGGGGGGGDERHIRRVIIGSYRGRKPANYQDKWVEWEEPPDDISPPISSDFNPDHLPIANLGLVVWADDFESKKHRNESTTNVACTYSVLPYPLRMSNSWIRIVATFPPGVDPMECFRLVFSFLLTAEKGEVMDLAGSDGDDDGDDKRILVRSGLYAGLSDSPFTAKWSYTMQQGAQFPCHICMFDNVSMADADQVINP